MQIEATCIDCGATRFVTLTRGFAARRCDSCRVTRERELGRKRRQSEKYRRDAAARTRRWVAANRERHRENLKLWALENPERKKENLRRWTKENAEHVKEYKRWQYELNRESVLEMKRRWKARNPEKVCAAAQRRRALKASASGSFTGEEFLALCEEHAGRCFYCHEERKLTADHAVPLSRGGSNDISNILPACASCNARKGTRTLQEFLGGGS